MNITYFVNVNENNDVIGYYNDDVNESIPDTAVEITKQQWLDALEMSANTFINNTFSYVEPALEPMSSEDITSFRKKAYTIESDPLFMEWQFDKTSESEQIWRDKVAEIKLRYPLP